MPLFIIALFGFLISWPITLSQTTFDQTNEFYVDITDESGYDSSIEDDDLSYDWPVEDEKNMTSDWSDEENVNSDLSDEDEENLNSDWSDEDRKI